MLKFNTHARAIKITKKLADESMHIKREDMPQVFGADFQKFKKFLQNENIFFIEKKEENPHNLKALQDEYNIDKILYMVDKGVEAPNPIIVSNDNFVLDGTHRFIAHYINNKMINVLQVDMSAKDLLVKMFDFDHVGSKKLHESSRRSLHVTELTDEDIERIKNSRVPEEYDYLNELDGL